MIDSLVYFWLNNSDVRWRLWRIYFLFDGLIFLSAHFQMMKSHQYLKKTQEIMLFPKTCIRFVLNPGRCLLENQLSGQEC